MRSAFVALITAALSVIPARADWRITSQVGGPITAVAARDSFAFVGIGSRVHIYDISDPASPREVGSTPAFGDRVSDIVVNASHAYIAAGTDGVHIADLTDHATPRLIGRWDSPGTAEGIAVEGALLIVADGPLGVQLVNVANPASPEAVGAVFDATFAFDVAVRGPYAFIAAADAGLLVANISAPDAPFEVTGRDTPGFARDVAIDESTLYLADQWGGVRIMSITDPRVPREISSVSLPSWAFAVAVDGARLLVADGAAGLRMIDVSDPSLPREVSNYPAPGRVSWKVVMSEGRALVGVRTEGVHIVEVAGAGAHRRAGMIAPLVSAGSVVTRGDFAYVLTADQGLRVIDVSQPDRLRERGRGVTLQGLVGCIDAADNGYVYIGSGIQGEARLDVVDATDPDRPVSVTSLSIFNFAREILHHASRLYIPDEYGLAIFDVSTPAVPVLRSRISFAPDNGVTSGATSVALAGTTAFVSAGGNGLNAVDVSDPVNMRIIGNWLPDVGSVGQLAWRDDVLYATTGLPSPRLFTLDVRDPRNPVLLAAVPLAGSTTGDVLLDGPYAYVANGGAGVAVIDIQNPAFPTEAGRIPTPGFALELAAAHGRLFVAAVDGGLLEIGRTPMTTSSSSAALPPPREREAAAAALPPARARSEKAAVTPPPVTGRSVIVTSAADRGPGTLREAMSTLAAGDVITFDPAAFPPDRPATIQVETPLPHLTVSDVVLDASNAGVILDGSRLSGQFESGLEIAFTSKRNTIRGLQILNFPSAGIFISGDGGNVIGGDRSKGRGPTGEGNVVSGNRKFGIHVGNPNGNRIIGNFVGTDATGRVPLGVQPFGVDIFYHPGNGTELGGDRIGGDQPWEANVIAGNVAAEVKLHNAGGHTVIGNFIGVDVDGNRIGASLKGIDIDASSDNVVTRNVIVSNHSVWIIDQGACCNRINENWIGVTRDGRIIPRRIPGENGIAINESFNLIFGNTFGGIPYAAVRPSGLSHHVQETIIAGNTFHGLSPSEAILGEAAIDIDAASRTFIGGSTPAFRNQLNAGRTGIRLHTGVDRTFILANQVGTDDQRSLQNATGIAIGTSTHTFVQNTTIVNASGSAIAVAAPQNRIRRNSIHGNGGAIDVTLAPGAPSPPLIAEVTATSVAGTACGGCVVEIFSDAETQARWYEGTTVADGTGRFTFTRTRFQGSWITATATDPQGSTSGLAEPVAAPPVPPRRRAVRH